MEMPSSQGGHSSRVVMRLLVNGDSFAINQMGRDFILLETPWDHPPGAAKIMMRVDEDESCWDIRLPEGISKNSERVAIAGNL